MLFGSWLDKFKKPMYDIDITSQYGKPHRERLNKPEVQARFGPSGPHPGIESGYMGGIVKTDKDWNIETPYTLAGKWNRPEGLWQSGGPNKIPTKKKGSMIKDIADALKDLKPGPDASKLTAEEFGGSRTAPLGFSLSNMGAYVGDPVARQTAMAKARMEEALQRRKKLLGGGY